LCSFYTADVFGENVEVSANRLVIFGPSDTLKNHVEKIQSTWPYSFAIAVVVGLNDPVCNTPEKGVAMSGNVTYCNLQVRVDDSIFVKWLVGDPTAPIDDYMIHYWYHKDKVFNINKGERILVFLSPTHGQGVFSPTMILRATNENISEVREVLRGMDIK